MAASSSNSESIVDIGEKFPYPSHVIAPYFFTVKLSGKDKYNVWKTQMLCLLRSHGMLGFIHDDKKYGKRILVEDEDMKNAWMRSDSLVTGWILGSLSEEVAMEVVNCLTSKHNNPDFTAKDAWDELQRSYGPSVAAAVNSSSEETKKGKKPKSKQEEEKNRISEELHLRIKYAFWGFVRDYLRRKKIKPTEKITNNGNTVLHVAVRYSTRDQDILRHLLDLQKNDPESSENTLLDLVNSDGSNLLHVAAKYGNTDAARILLETNIDLLLAKDKDHHTPLALSLYNMHTKTSRCLIDHIKNDVEKKDKLFSGDSGDELLVLAISSKNFRLALELLKHYRTIHSEAVLMAIAQNFPCELNFWGVIRDKEDIIDRVREFGNFRCIWLRGCCCWEEPLIFFLRGIRRIQFYFGVTLSYIVWPFIKTRVGVLKDASDLSEEVCEKIFEETDRSDRYYLNPVFEATRQNAFVVVEQIVTYFPEAIQGTNKDGHNFFQYAVINRSEQFTTCFMR